MYQSIDILIHSLNEYNLLKIVLMKQLHIYEKLFARDFCLPSVEAGLEEKAQTPKVGQI